MECEEEIVPFVCSPCILILYVGVRHLYYILTTLPPPPCGKVALLSVRGYDILWMWNTIIIHSNCKSCWMNWNVFMHFVAISMTYAQFSEYLTKPSHLGHSKGCICQMLLKARPLLQEVVRCLEYFCLWSSLIFWGLVSDKETWNTFIYRFVLGDRTSSMTASQ